MGTRMIYFDIDGVLRLLDVAVLGEHASDWVATVDGLGFCDYVSKNKHLLVEAKPSEYVDVVRNEFADDVIHFLTVQPEDWRPFTAQWLETYFGDRDYIVLYCSSPEEKLGYLRGENSVLFDDYPYKEPIEGLYIVSRPYNISSPAWRRIAKPEDMVSVIRRVKEVNREFLIQGYLNPVPQEIWMYKGRRVPTADDVLGKDKNDKEEVRDE